jgi:hypothetical protein
MSKTAHVLALTSLLLPGCATVRQEDLAAWRGRPVAELDRHPIFATMRLTKTYAADGTEIRNYVNGSVATSCAGGGFVNSTAPGMANVSQHANCVSTAPTCNNVFHVKNGIVESYTPIGTGGAKCYTDDRARPDFRGATNL